MTAILGSRAVAVAAADELRGRYVFADVGQLGADRLDEAAAMGAYDGLTGDELASALTRDLRREVPDAHLRVRWQAEPRTANSGASDWEDPEFMAAYWRDQDAVNQGVSRAERLAGNIGLLVVHTLDEPEGAGAVVEAALSFVGRCDALVLDVRNSNGGAPSGVAFWVSHFVAPPSRKLVSLLDRAGATVEQTWTTPYVRAPRFVDQPVYVLTSAGTPSGAEELAYDLQAMTRATVVGETTAGAANPVDQHALDAHFMIQVPTARVVHAITGGNWEGVGVVPDVPCAAVDALTVAHRLAAEALVARPEHSATPDRVRRELAEVLA